MERVQEVIQNTAYSFDRSRQRRVKNNGNGVRNNRGEIETDYVKILEVYRGFYAIQNKELLAPT